MLDVAYALGALAAVAVAVSGLAFGRGDTRSGSRWLVAAGVTLAVVFAVVVLMTQLGHL